MIESGTQAILDWLIALDLDALTLEDEAEVTQMNTNYNMLTEGQKAFLDDYVDKLQSAVAKIAELKGETPDSGPGIDPAPDPGTSSNLGLIIGLSVAGVVVVVAVVVVVLLLLRRKKNTDKAPDGENSEESPDDAIIAESVAEDASDAEVSEDSSEGSSEEVCESQTETNSESAEDNSAETNGEEE